MTNEPGTAKATILVVDDKSNLQVQLEALLDPGRYRFSTVGSIEQAIQLLKTGASPHLIVAEAGAWNYSAVQAYKSVYPLPKVIVASGAGNLHKVVESLKSEAAADYIIRPFDKDQVESILNRHLSTCAIDKEWAPAKPPDRHGKQDQLIDGNQFFIGASPAMNSLRSQLPLIARVDVPVLILGESGVGKEVIATLIHRHSKRAHCPLQKINCAALPAELLESELFGYEKGAFTGAFQSKPGKFEASHRGTVLLDEIGEMHPSLQAKLLHVLQDGQFSRLGGRSNVIVDFRVLAATNIDILAAVKNGKFREDLYYRLNAFTIHMPPLRERPEEIPLLIKHFVTIYANRLGCRPMEYSQQLLECCTRHRWPGNVRELENFVKRHLIFRDEQLAISELQKTTLGLTSLNKERTGGEDLKSQVRDVKAQIEQKAIQVALEETGWNRSLAARRLNISYRCLIYKMKRYGQHLDATAGVTRETKKRPTAA